MCMVSLSLLGKATKAEYPKSEASSSVLSFKAESVRGVSRYGCKGGQMRKGAAGES